MDREQQPTRHAEYTGNRATRFTSVARSPYFRAMKLRSALLFVAILTLGGCDLIHRYRTPPVNTVDVPTVADDVADSLLVDVRTIDSTIVVDMRYATPNNFTGAPLPGYEANKAYMRAEAVAALALVQEDLRLQGMGLKIFDAYRPVRASEAMVAWTQRVNRPDLLKDGYIAARSRHNLGVAVDLTLISFATKAEITMGTPFDHFSPAAFTNNASGYLAKNRQMLKKVMERQGFRNYEKEWWHFSYAVENPVRFDRVIR